MEGLFWLHFPLIVSVSAFVILVELGALGGGIAGLTAGAVGLVKNCSKKYMPIPLIVALFVVGHGCLLIAFCFASMTIDSVSMLTGTLGAAFELIMK